MTVYHSSTCQAGHQRHQRSWLLVGRQPLPARADRVARATSRSASGVSTHECVWWTRLVTVVSPWTLVTAEVRPELCQGLSPLKLAPFVGDRLNMSTRQTGSGARGRTYGPFHAQGAHHRLTRRHSRHTQVRHTQIHRLLGRDQGKMSSRYPGSRP